jgi:hypothetical protein
MPGSPWAKPGLVNPGHIERQLHALLDTLSDALGNLTWPLQRQTCIRPHEFGVTRLASRREQAAHECCDQKPIRCLPTDHLSLIPRRVRQHSSLPTISYIPCVVLQPTLL